MSNFKPHIKKIIHEFSNRFEKHNEEQYKNCFMSDLTRMDLIETFFNNIKNNPNYNIQEPDYSKLIDNWSGYDDQVYIQNNLTNNQFIYWEGWVDECWKALYLKPEYNGLNKIEAIEKIIKTRFPRLGDEFNYKMIDFNYFKHKGKYIMKVVFENSNI